MGFPSRHVDKTLHDFKDYIGKRGRESGAWRGEVRAGMKQPDGSGRLTGSSTGPGMTPGGKR